MRLSNVVVWGICDETEAATSPPTELEHAKYPSYTPMAALSHKQLQLKPSAYANLSDYHPTSD